MQSYIYSTTDKTYKCLVTYGEHSCAIHDRTLKRLIGAGELRDGVYCLKKDMEAISFVVVQAKEAILWHQRLEHPFYGSLSTLCSLYCFEINKELCDCSDVCHTAKQTKNSFPIN